MPDFTIQVYQVLLKALLEQKYSFQTCSDFFKGPLKKTTILRHDIDARNSHSLDFAQLQNEFGIKGTYYFRVIPQSFDRDIISIISSMGHEIGYHYEDMDLANGDPHKAIRLFEKHLETIRKVAPVKTICMHGSPLSKYDNRDLWKYYDYRDYDILAEPYFDLDFSNVLYLTDTGRRWDGDRVSIRDRAASSAINKHMQGDKRSLSEIYSFRQTEDIIQACKMGALPEQMMLNFHPQRWTGNPLLWTRELVVQNLKNVVKGTINLIRRS